MKSPSALVRRARTAQSAFTLVELLVITVAILILTGITFGVSKGVLNQQARTKAKAELAIIAQALEEFKLAYGDYPVVSEDTPLGNANSKKLTLALTGFTYLESGDTLGTRKMTEVADNEVRESFIPVEKLSLSRPFRDPGNPAQVPNSVADMNRIFLVDPWRQPYVYIYNKGAATNSWDNVGYVLFSKGPDGTADIDDTVEDTGIFDPNTINNIDNIYPNQ